MQSRLFFFVLLLLLLSSFSSGSTTCEVKDCRITITMKIAFSGTDDTYINRAKSEIENIWNGPNGQSYGDCKCPVGFNVEVIKTADCINNPPAGYHCIAVTNYNNDPPRNQTNWTGATFYIGYMYGIATGNGGNSQKGWWSDIMSRPVDPANPQEEHYKDFAHEAGHMMGLEDCDGGLMCNTSGPNSSPTQANINEAVEEICGLNACPDRCCCGNGIIDTNKNEQCDPMAGGCQGDQYCCPVCCQCYGKVCFPENGEYGSQETCQAGCGPGAKCYYNYKTGCWDCVTQVVVEEPEYVGSKIRSIVVDDHTRQANVQKIRDFYDEGLARIPMLREFLADERINLIVAGKNNHHLLINKGELYEVGGGAISDPTATVETDGFTLDAIEKGTLSPITAFKDKRVRIRGNGFFNEIKFWLFGIIADNFISSEAVAEQEAAAGWGPYEETHVRDIPAGVAAEKKPDAKPAGGALPEGPIPEEVLKSELR